LEQTPPGARRKKEARHPQTTITKHIKKKAGQGLPSRIRQGF
jgi:hypothetical protein